MISAGGRRGPCNLSAPQASSLGWLWRATGREETGAKEKQKVETAVAREDWRRPGRAYES